MDISTPTNSVSSQQAPISTPPSFTPLQPSTPPPQPPPTFNISPSSSPPTITPVALGIGLLVLLIIISTAIAFGVKYLASTKKSSGSIQNLQGLSNSVPSKYTLDTDTDGIPDALENELGFDPSVSEFTRCQPASCDSANASQTQTTTNNILFIIDASGSMGLTIGDKTKMDLAKDAIRNFLKSTAANVKVGIMVYGDKGSNSPSDKAVSCASAEVIAPVGSANTTTIDGYLAQIQPIGWTPIGLAIQQGKSVFVGKEGQKNQMIIVTDGGETCDTNPAAAASEAKSSPYQIQVDVIGFAVNASEQSSLQTISINGGGLFSVATNADQLLSQIQASHANFEKFQAGAKCTSDTYTKSITCLQDTQQKVFDYLQTQLANLHGNANQEMSNLQSKISSLYFKKINTLQDEQNAAIKNSQQQLVK